MVKLELKELVKGSHPAAIKLPLVKVLVKDRDKDRDKAKDRGKAKAKAKDKAKDKGKGKGKSKGKGKDKDKDKDKDRVKDRAVKDSQGEVYKVDWVQEVEIYYLYHHDLVDLLSPQ